MKQNGEPDKVSLLIKLRRLQGKQSCFQGRLQSWSIQTSKQTYKKKKKKRKKTKVGVDEREVHCHWNKTFPQQNWFTLQPLSIVNSKVSCYMFFSFILNISRTQTQPEKALFMVSHPNKGNVNLKLLCATLSITINIFRATSTLYCASMAEVVRG